MVKNSAINLAGLIPHYATFYVTFYVTTPRLNWGVSIKVRVASLDVNHEGQCRNDLTIMSHRCDITPCLLRN